MSCAPIRPSAPRAGFTLIEVILAMGVLVIGVSVLLSLLTFGAALTRTASLRTTSSTAIQAVLHDLEETLFPLQPDGSVGEPAPIVDRPVPGAPGAIYNATAEPNPEGPRVGEDPLEYKVVIDVSWRAGGVRRARRYETILLRQVPFGERMRRRFVGSESSPQRPSTPAISASGH